MNPFQGFLTPQRSENNSQSSKVHFNASTGQHKRKLIKLTTAEDNEDPRADQFDPKLILKAMNNSFTQRMSDHFEEVQILDIFSIINEYGLSLHRLQSAEEVDISIQRWCIVALDEKHLHQTGIGQFGAPLQSLLSFCGSSKIEKAQEMEIQREQQLPSTLKLYSLVLNMNNKQLVFQSHQEPSNRFYINLDTVQANIQDVDPKSHFTPIILTIQQKEFPIQLHLYVTRGTLPFPFSEDATEEAKLELMLKNKQSLFSLLAKSVIQSRGRQFGLKKAMENAILNQTKFYNDRFATEEQFSHYCQTGDIMLFRDSHTMAKVQRALTNSPYDHVGIVYKSEQLGICLFESSSGTGVGLASWKQLIRFHWFQGIEKISWRKLQLHDKKPDFQEKVTEFVKGNLHKQFGLSLPKLLKFKSISYSHDDKRSYFCSELVATLYKYMGILEPSKSSTQYWPKDFADGNGLQILGGALDPERELVFEHKILKESYKFYQQNI